MSPEQLPPGGVSKRRYLKEIAGRLKRLSAATAVAVGGGVLNAALDLPHLKKPGEKIDSFRTRRGGFDTDKRFHTAAAEPVIGAERFSRAEYVQHIFSTTQPVDMPISIRNKLAVVAPGIPAQESRYDNAAMSSAGAKYIWQFTSPAVAHINKLQQTTYTLEDTQALTVATSLAFTYFDRVLYRAVKEPAARLIAAFGLEGNQEALEQFTVFCMVNAYNAGSSRMENVLKNFAEKYTPRHVHQVYEYTPLSLFNALSEVALQPPGVLDPGYKERSSEYVFGALAGAESLNAQYKLAYEQSLVEIVSAKAKGTFYAGVQEIVKPAVAGVVGGAIGYGAGRAITQGSMPPKTVPRRRFLKTGFAAAVVSGMAGHHALKGNINAQQLPDVSSWMWWRIGQQKG